MASAFDFSEAQRSGPPLGSFLGRSSPNAFADAWRMLRLLAGTAFMALGVVVVAALLSALLFMPDLVDAIALAGAHFFSADDLIRRDMAQDLAFEAALAWTVVFLAILFLRAPAPRGAFNPTPEGRHHGN